MLHVCVCIFCSTQRDQLQSDLSVVTTKASKVQGELDAVQRMSGEAAARFFDDKSKVQLKSLQHVRTSTRYYRCLPMLLYAYRFLFDL